MSGLLLLFLSVGFVSAAGIVSPYWEGYPLQMNYGETRVINFNLQNMVGNEDINIKVSVKGGSEIASLEKTTYSAKAGTSDTLIPLKIIVPKDYNKQVQKVSLEFNSVAPSDKTGMVTLGTGWTTSFDVVLSENPIDKRSLVWIIILLVAVVLVLALIIYLMLSRRKRKW